VQLRINYQELQHGVFYQRRGLKIGTFPVAHRGPGCFGFLFEEESRLPFLAQEAERLGVPAGPERRLLVQGQSIGLAERTAEVQRRCRTALQAQADALMATANHLFAHTNHVDLTLASV
jgi:hypothetical protein